MDKVEEPGACGAGHSPTLIASAQRALRLLEVVAEDGSARTAKGLARGADLPLSTTYHLLRTLVHDGYLTRCADGTYTTGPRLTQLCARARTEPPG